MDSAKEKQLPQYRILSGSMLKLLAVVTMLIDHTAVYIVSNHDVFILSLFGRTLTLCTLMRMIGRIAFPLFAFGIAEGYYHTHDKKKYAVNLLVFALISEFCWNLAHCGKLFYPTQNVYFTLLLGYLAIWLLDKGGKKPLLMLLGLIAVFLAACFGRTDYGVRGVAVVVLMYFLREKPFARFFTVSCIMPSALFACFAFLPIAMYNGERGFVRSRALKYAFYIVYPLQYFIFYCIVYGKK